MSAVIAGVDISATPDADAVVVFERRGDRWHLLHPDSEPPAALQVPDLPPSPQVHRWTEETLTETAEGWMREFAEGQFVLDDEQLAVLTQAYERLIREGKLTTFTTASLTDHVDRARSAR